jgi:hypothetical protein
VLDSKRSGSKKYSRVDGKGGRRGGEGKTSNTYNANICKRTNWARMLKATKKRKYLEDAKVEGQPKKINKKG